jgi:hypothetical protein
VKYQQDKYAEDYSEGDHVAVKWGQFISAAIWLTVCYYLLALLVVFNFYVLVIVYLTMVSNFFNKRTPLCGVRLSGLGREGFFAIEQLSSPPYSVDYIFNRYIYCLVLVISYTVVVLETSLEIPRYCRP